MVTIMYTEWISQLTSEGVGHKNVAMDPAQLLEQTMLSRQKGMVEATARGDSAIQRYYDNATVLVTGGSGFLGKQLVEKLFRACNIRRVYLLMRPKKGMQAQDRLKGILEDPVYSSLLQQKPSFPDSITCLSGDVAETRLGLSDEDWNTVTNEVDMIFHVAATTRFDESLRVATLINVRGTRDALMLARECKKLRSFVYVSTAYSHATSDKIGQPVTEQFYDTPIAPDALIRMAESVNSGVLDDITPKLTTGWPNTYTFAKAVAEEQVRLVAGDMPVCIVRPSIVISAHYEPAPGWLDISSARSASGFVIGSGLGLLHVMQTSPSTDLSLVPVDYVNNALLAAGWEVGTRGGEGDTRGGEGFTRGVQGDTKIYNFVMTQENKLTWELLRSYCMVIREELPMPSAIYLAYVFCVRSYYSFLLLSVLLHFIPACLADAVLTVLGQERKFLRIYKKIYKLSLTLSYFLNTTYYLDGKNTEKLFEKLSPIDKTIFFFDMRNINWFEFSQVWCMGVRKYLIKDGLKNTEMAKRKQFFFKYVNYVVLSVYGCVLWFVLRSFVAVLGRIWLSMVAL